MFVQYSSRARDAKGARGLFRGRLFKIGEKTTNNLRYADDMTLSY